MTTFVTQSPMSTSISSCCTCATTALQHSGLPDLKCPRWANGVTAAKKAAKKAEKAAREVGKKGVEKKNLTNIKSFELAEHVRKELDDQTPRQTHITKQPQEDNLEMDVEQMSSTDFEMTDELNPDRQTYQPSETPTDNGNGSLSSTTENEGTTTKKRLYSTVAKVGTKYGICTAAQGPADMNQGTKLPSSSKSKPATYSDDNTAMVSNSPPPPPPVIPKTPAPKPTGAQKLVQKCSDMPRPEPKAASLMGAAHDKTNIPRPKARAAPLVRSKTLLVPGHYEPQIILSRPKKLTTKANSQVKLMENPLPDAVDDMIDISSNSDVPAPSIQSNNRPSAASKRSTH